MRNRLVFTAAGALLAASMIGCDGPTGGRLISGPTGGARVRVFNAVTSSSSLDFLVDGQVAATGIAFGAASPYASVSLGSHQLQVRSTTSGTALLDFTRDFAAEGAFSLILAPGLSQSGVLFLADDPTPVSGQGRVRVIHAAAAPGAVSVYVTGPDVELTSATPAIPALSFGSASTYVNVAPGTYRVRITRAGSPGDVLLDNSGVVVGASTVRSLVLTDSPNGGLPTAMSIVSDSNQ